MAFTGLVAELPIGRDGLSGSLNPSKVGPGHLIVADTVTYEGDVLRKEGGASHFNASAIASTPKILGGYDWHPDASTQRQIVLTSAGKLTRTSSGTAFDTDLKTDLGTSDANKVPMFVEAGKEAAQGNKKLFIFSGEDQCQVLSGDGATNLLLYSQDWSNAAWTKGQCTVANSNNTDPNGAATATKIEETAVTNSHVVSQSIVLTASTTYMLSVYVKAAERSWILLNLKDKAAASNYSGFQLTGSGVLGTSGGSAANRVITSLPNGWYRISFTASSGAGGGTPAFEIYLETGDAVSSYLGVLANGALMYGAQLELGSTLHDYVHTYGASAALGPIAAPPTDWSSVFPTFGVVHGGRLWAGGNSNDPHRLYYSTTTNHEDFLGTGSGSLSIFPGVGQKLVCAISFKGLLVVFKYPKGIYAVDTSNATVTNWTNAVISNAIGAAGPRAVVPIEDDLLVMDAQGHFHLLSTITEFGNLSSRNISQKDGINIFAADFFNPLKLPRAKAIFYPVKREAWFAVPSSAATVNDMRIIVDFNHPTDIRFRSSTRDVCEALWLKTDANGVERPVSGDDVGFAWTMDEATRSKNGAGYAATFQSGNYDMSFLDPRLAYIVKYGRFLELTIESTGNNNLAVDVIWDDILTQTINFNMGISGSALGTGALDTMTLGAVSVLNRKKRMIGGGRRLSLRGYNSGATQDFAIARFLVHFVPGDERRAST